MPKNNIDKVDADSDQQDGNQEAGEGARDIGGLQRGSLESVPGISFDASHQRFL